MQRSLSCRLLTILSVATCLVVVAPETGRRSQIHADDAVTRKLLEKFVSEFVRITPGNEKFLEKFEMGSDEGQTSERPRHEVTISRPFSIAKYEVPQNLYEAVMGVNPSRWKGARNSVEMVSWDDANLFCAKVTERLHQEKLIGEGDVVRLPTEAEWEYCCRAGTTTQYSFGDKAQKEDDLAPKASILSEYAWHTGNAAGNDPPVGALKPNPWGLYDMHGYLWELTADAWSPNYQQTPTDGRAVTVKDITKSVVIRGGSWKDPFTKLTSSARGLWNRTAKDDAIGFRCVVSAPLE